MCSDNDKAGRQKCGGSEGADGEVVIFGKVKSCLWHKALSTDGDFLYVYGWYNKLCIIIENP